MRNKISKQAQEELFDVLVRHGIDLTPEVRLSLVKPLAGYLYVREYPSPLRTATEILGYSTYHAYILQKSKMSAKRG